MIEKGGTKEIRGRPLAFIETAWRRYTKHSRNKAQEIQGALLPIAENHQWDKPFLGAILAGIFTDGSLKQMQSSGFEVVLFPYHTIVEAFAAIGINAAFNENTPDTDFKETIGQIEILSESRKNALKDHLIFSNQHLLSHFFDQLQATLDRMIDHIILIPLYGCQNKFTTIDQAFSFIQSYNETTVAEGSFREYQVIVKYSNGDKIEGSFQDKQKTLRFLQYLAEA